MPLLIATGASTAIPPDDPTAGAGVVVTSDEMSVIRDLNFICLGNLIDNEATTPYVTDDDPDGSNYDQLTYNQPNPAFGADLVTFLINSKIPTMIFGVIDPNGIPGNGETIPQFAADHSLTSLTVIYDASNCGGNGSWVLDVLGQRIPNYPYIMLAHEFGHAQAYINGTDTSQAQAIAVENQVRAETNGIYKTQINPGVSLSQRNPSNDGGGCNPPSSKPPSGGNPWGFCFMITAAFGATAAENQEFRHIRETWVGSSRLGFALFYSLATEYSTYAGPVAQAMGRSERLRDSVKTLVLEPLLIHFRNLDDLLHSSVADTALADRCELRLQAFRTGLLGQGYTPTDTAAIAEFYRRLDAALHDTAVDETRLMEIAGCLSDCPARTQLESSLWYVATQLRQHSYPAHLTWFATGPLAACWHLLTGAAAEGTTLDRMRYQAATWIGRMPIPALYAQMTQEQAARELSRMGGSFLTSRIMRVAFRERLLELFAERVPYSLASLLDELDFR
jgi:hypothetical protein